MKTSKLTAAGASILATAMLFAGCAGLTYEPKVDVFKLPVTEDADFYTALEAIGIEASEVDVIEDTGFKFTGEETDYDIKVNLDAVSGNNNRFSYTRCADEETAKELFDYYYKDYAPVFDAKDFSGISSHEIGNGAAYVLIHGRTENKTAGTYTPYHDALYLKGDTLIVVTAGDYDLQVDKEIDDFLDALGYPHP